MRSGSWQVAERGLPLHPPVNARRLWKGRVHFLPSDLRWTCLFVNVLCVHRDSAGALHMGLRRVELGVTDVGTSLRGVDLQVDQHCLLSLLTSRGPTLRRVLVCTHNSFAEGRCIFSRATENGPASTLSSRVQPCSLAALLLSQLKSIIRAERPRRVSPW